MKHERVLVSFDTFDDAGVYKLDGETALVQTVDFFTPIVDDPWTFGAIAAANALSDVYAMGGRPITALAIVAYPSKGDPDVLAEILRGGAEKMQEAGCVVLGGHSVGDEEVKFGYAVTGLVHPDRILSNAAARPGDELVLTKPLGTGLIATALKRGLADPAHVQASVNSMVRLNRQAAEAAIELGAHACTDVTGFGLLGHAREMAVASGVTIEIQVEHLQWLPGALDYAAGGCIPGGLQNNRKFFACEVDLRRDVPEPVLAGLYDPQTSGGLLVALPAGQVEAFLERVPEAFRAGRVDQQREKPVTVR